jgi:PAS domain S-box-containing protein
MPEATQASLRAILDTAADAIIGASAEARVVSVNPAAERMFGRPSAELLGLALGELLPGLDTERLRATMADSMLMHSTQSRVGQLELQALRHGGTAFPVELLLGEIANDAHVRYTCIVRDLTEAKFTEEYLALYSRAVDCALNGICISDARNYPQPLVHVNPAFSRITGYAPHEVLGRDTSLLNGALTDPDDLALLARTLRSGGELGITLLNYRKDGSPFHNKLSVSPVRDAQGRITHYIHVIEDVSAQIEVKQRLIERTARLNATFDLSPDGFVVFDASDGLVSTNPAFQAMAGPLPPEVRTLAAFERWFAALCGGETPEFTTAPTNALTNAPPRVFHLQQPALRVLECEVRRTKGLVAETFLYFRDVTQQREVDRLKSEFLATAAHELRTPLASILGFTELMIHRRYSDEKRLDLLQTVHRQGKLLANLIQELLDLSRIEARQGKDFHIVPTPLTAIVRAAIQDAAGTDLARSVTVGEIPDVLVLADAAKIQQALTNLLSNAFKYSPAGGPVALTARVEAGAGGADGADGTGFVAVAVRDEGLGMTPVQLQRAFERFYRADTSGNIPGTGLGLNLVKEIVELHGGTVSLDSSFGQGTTATLRLPLVVQPAAATLLSAA